MIAEFVERNSRYSKIQARELYQEGKRFQWNDLIRKPLGEFLGRFFANKGYEDGIQVWHLVCSSIYVLAAIPLSLGNGRI